MSPDDVDEVDPTGEEVVETIARLKASVTYFVFDLLRCGLHSHHRLALASLLTIRLMLEGGYCGLEPTFVSRLVLSRAAEESGGRGAALSEWLGELEWARVKALEADFPCFADLGSKMAYDAAAWKQWFEAHDPEQAIMPSMLQERLDDLQKLLFVNAVRPDRVVAYLVELVRANVAADQPSRYLVEVPYPRSSILSYASSRRPLLLLLDGADPTSWVVGKAKERNLTCDNARFAVVHMGGLQQRERAEMLLSKLGKLGGWLLLQAVHVCSGWVDDWLVPYIEASASQLHPNFRLFLTAQLAGPQLPLSLLRCAYRQACEQPTDLRGHLQRSLRTFGARAPPSPCVLSKEDYKACLFGLSFFHSLLVRRRQVGFAAQGPGFCPGSAELASAVQVSSKHTNTVRAASPNPNPNPHLSSSREQPAGRVMERPAVCNGH